MTENQYRSHQEQIDAAREEFKFVWSHICYDKEWADCDMRQRMMIHDWCWKTFLHAKGLA